MEEKGNPLIIFLIEWLENTLETISKELLTIPAISTMKEELEELRSKKND